MIRITGGKFKQKKLASINDFVRPTSSLKREAFFSVIESYAIKNSIELYKNKPTPVMPIGADLLMTKYNIIQGKQLGEKLKIIEKEWVENNFKISEKQVDKIVND